jgi:hypothetical protein
MDRNERAKERYHRELNRRVFDSLANGNARALCDHHKEEALKSRGLKWEDPGNTVCPDCGVPPETDDEGIIHHFHKEGCCIVAAIHDAADETTEHIH